MTSDEEIRAGILATEPKAAAVTQADTAPVTAPSYHVVTIWHNVHRDHAGVPVGFFGYETGHAMSPVFVYVAKHSGPADAFRMFNAPEDYLTPEELTITRRYRANRLRSLSVGDIVQAGQQFWVCESVGWTKLGTNVPLNVQPSPYESEQWSGTAGAELPRARRDYARAAYSAALERTGNEETAVRVFRETLGESSAGELT